MVAGNVFIDSKAHTRPAAWVENVLQIVKRGVEVLEI
jgi:hypothetical protein